MTDLRKTLLQLKNIEKPSNQAICDLNNSFAEKLLIKYHVISYVMQELNRCFVFDDYLVPPTPEEVLEMKPVVLANELYSTESLIELAADRVVPIVSEYTDFISEVLKLFYSAKSFTLQPLRDKTIRELIWRLPEDPEHRIYRYIQVSNDCTIYFIRNRYMLITNRGTKSNDRESHIDLVTIVDMGTMVYQMLNEDYDYYLPTDNPSTGRLKPVYCKYDARVINYKIYLSDVSTTYPYVNTFCESISKRQTHTFNAIFPKVKDISIHNQTWDTIKRTMGIPNIESVLSRQEALYV